MCASFSQDETGVASGYPGAPAANRCRFAQPLRLAAPGPGDNGVRRDRDGYPPGVGPEERNAAAMGISVSLILIAVGAILTWAVTATVSGIDLTTVGVIL